MNATRIAAIALILAGIAGLVLGTFAFTTRTHEAKIGTLEMSVQEKRTVAVPLWASVGAIVVGGALLVVPRRNS